MVENYSSDLSDNKYTLRPLQTIKRQIFRPDIQINEQAKFDTGTTMVYLTHTVYSAIETVIFLYKLKIYKIVKLI